MMYREYRNYYVPGSARELRDRLRKYWTDKKIQLPKGFSHMPKKQLYAIYHNIMSGKSKPRQARMPAEKRGEKTTRLEKAVQMTLFS